MNDVNGNKILANKQASNIPYLIAVLIVVMFSAILILGITLVRPDKDNTTLITLVLGFMAPVILTLMTFIKSSATDTTVNSRMGELMKLIKEKAYAEGVVEGGRPQVQTIQVVPAPVAPIVLTVPGVTPPPPPTVPGTAAIHTGDTVKVEKEK